MKIILQRTFIFTIYLLLYTPILILILYSFNNARYSLTWHGFSLQWYNELFQDRALWSAFFNSFFLGLCAAIIATGFSIMVCVNLFLFRSKHHHILHVFLLLLIIIPDLVLGVALLVFFNLARLPLGFFSLIIAHITFCLPFCILTLNARLKTLQPTVYLSALDLGASHYVALTKILLPLLWPAVLSAFLLSFTLSFDDVIISYFIAGPDFNILPLAIYSLVRSGVTPELNALCSITFCFSVIIVVFSYYLRGTNG